MYKFGPEACICPMYLWRPTGLNIEGDPDPSSNPG